MTDDDDEPQEELLPTEQLTVDAASPISVKRAQSRKKRDERESADFWSGIWGAEIGRREMWKILASAGTFETTFACGPNGFPQPENTWFHAGQRDFGQRLYQTWLVRDPQSVALMHSENDSRFFARPKKQDD